MEPAQQKSPDEGTDSGRVPMPPPLPKSVRTTRDRFVLSESPPVVAKTTERASAFCIVPHEGQSKPRKESAVWSGSILLHALILVVIALLVAPADLGGTAMHIIQLSFADEPDENKSEESVEFVSMEAEPSMESVETDVIAPEPIPVAPLGSGAIASDGDGDGMQQSDGRQGADAAGGSFFGIQASGQNFVYVLDQSGSMEGQRFRRAAEELIRSVETLSEEQKFFVVLFNTQMHQMFDQQGLTPSAIPATRDNKRKLARWLNQVDPSGGTDPRMGLKLAMQMQPNAIFMLSDGEFRDDKKRRNGLLRAADGNTKQMVERMDSAVPIHAIAFEDPNSCVNMQELATLTGGEYRFVTEVRLSEEEMVEMANDAINLSDPQDQIRQLGKLADDFASDHVGDAAKLDYETKLLDLAQQSLEANQPLDAVGLLGYREKIRRGVHANDAKVLRLLQEISTQWERCDAPDDLLDAGQQLTTFPRSAAAESAVESLVPHLQGLPQKQKPTETFLVLQALTASYRGTSAGSLSQDAGSLLFDDLATQSNERRLKGDLVGALDIFVGLRAEGARWDAGQPTEQAILELSREMFGKARDASTPEEKESIRDALRKSLGDDSLYEMIRSKYGGDELQARKIMRQATRAIRVGDVDLARRLLDSIM
ncbi:MAG: VWA domain-containing protein, partial [Planctomycetota bacterium]